MLWAFHKKQSFSKNQKLNEVETSQMLTQIPVRKIQNGNFGFEKQKMGGELIVQSPHFK